MKPSFVDYLASHLLVGSVAAMLLLVFGTAVALAWSPNASAPPDAVLADVKVPEQRVVLEQVTNGCEECGIIESLQLIKPVDDEAGERGGRDEIADKPDNTSDVSVTVRMNDGSSRVFIDSSFKHWRRGERVIVIGGNDVVSD